MNNEYILQILKDFLFNYATKFYQVHKCYLEVKSVSLQMFGAGYRWSLERFVPPGCCQCCQGCGEEQ